LISLSGTIVAVSIATVRRAECQIASCERCDRTADIPFHRVLDWLSIGPAPAHYVMPQAARCPRCGGFVLEHTLIELPPPDGARGPR